MSKISVVLKNMAIKLVVFGLFIILLGNVNLAAAQEPGPTSGEPACTGHGVPTYEEWVKDLPCKPRYLMDKSTSMETQLSGMLEEPDGTNGVSQFGEWTYLVFQSYRDENWEIYGSSSERSYQFVRMTVDPASDVSPRVRPGALQVAFSSDRSGLYEIYLMDWGGSNVKRLTSHLSYASQPAWSPDGKKLAFVSGINGNLEIYVMDADGSNQKQLTNSPTDDFSPAWSPDGTQILWVRTVDKEHGVIYSMSVDGSSPRAVTDPLRFVEHLAWSSDGLHVAFDFDANGDDWFDLGLMNANGEYLTTRAFGWKGVDYLAGAWSLIDPQIIYVTRVQYVVYKEEYYISAAYLGDFYPGTANFGIFPNSELDFFPDVALVDLSIPETYVEPLPAYERAGEFPVTVVGTDTGPAGIVSVIAEFRYGIDGVWLPLSGTGQWSFKMNADPGQVVYFRSRGIDEADHAEPWPETWDTYTQVYAWELNGSLVDNRGVGIVNAAVKSQPAFSDQNYSDAQGSFHRYVPASTVEVEVSKTGYNAVPKRTLTSQEDLYSNWVLPPEDNLIEEGKMDFSLYPKPAAAGLDVPSIGGFDQLDNPSSLNLGSVFTQVVTLTSDLHQPTLSFLYQFTNVDGQGIFEVSVNDQSVFTTTQQQFDFTHKWVDLTPWENQTITLTFQVENQAPQNSMVVVNQGTVGSWLTPILEGVAPGDAKAGTPLVLTLTGDNFIDPPTVRLDDQAYTGLTYIDEHTLELSLSTGLKPGIYDVWVANPGGQEALLPAALQVGERVFLPLLTSKR